MVKKTKSQKDISHFLEVLEKVAVSPGGGEGATAIPDLGLIIFEKGSSFKVDDILKVMPEGKGLEVVIDNPWDKDLFTKKLVEANREGQYLVIDLRVDPHPKILAILKNLISLGSINTSHFEDKELFRVSLNPKTRLIFCAKRNILEEVITYPYFINLFGPILSL